MNDFDEFVEEVLSREPATPTKAAKFVLRCEKAWLDLVAQNMNKEATVWGPVVEAMQDNEPALALSLARERGVDRTTILAICEAFDISQDERKKFLD